MSKVKMMVTACFVVAFGAGLVAGLAWSKRAGAMGSGGVATGQPAAAAAREEQRPAGENRDRRWWIDAQLELSAAQQEQIHKIWDEARKEAFREREERREAIRKARDEAILAMMPTEKRENYEKIKKDYTERMSQLDRERPKAMERSVEQTRQVLSEQQRTKYEELMKKWGQERHNHGTNRRGDEKATTRPAITQPSH